MKGDTCTCATCKYQWPWGTDGDHSCVEYLLKEIERLRADVPRQPPRRWEINCGMDHGDCMMDYDAEPDGEWVKWDDIAHLYNSDGHHG